MDFILSAIGIIIITACFIAGIMLEHTFLSKLAIIYEVSGIMIGVLFLGFGRLLELLIEISKKLDKLKPKAEERTPEVKTVEIP